MDRLRFGIAYRGFGANAGDFAAEMEQLGFDSVWIGEHIANWAPTPTVVPIMAAFAARTSRISIGSSVLLLPLRHPTLIAKELAILDHISNGRVVAGIGVGGENPAEFAACGIPARERGSRTDEMLELMLRLWQEDGVTFRGRHFTLDRVTIAPKPVQQGGPRIVMGGRTEAAMRRAVRFGRGFAPYLYSPEQYAKAVAQIRSLAEAAERDIADFDWDIHIFTCLADSKDAARERTARALGSTYRQDFTALVDRYCLLGTPADCAARMREYVQAGVRQFAFSLITRSPEETAAMIAREVVPELRAGSLP